jgi:hypothetical protein
MTWLIADEQATPDHRAAAQLRRGEHHHAQRHSVSRQEIEQVVRNFPEVCQARRNGVAIVDHYLLVGVTDADRRITVVVLYPIT